MRCLSLAVIALVTAACDFPYQVVVADVAVEDSAIVEDTAIVEDATLEAETAADAGTCSDASQCTKCASDSCTSEALTCNSDPVCHEWLICAGRCACPRAACIAECEKKYPVDKAKPLFECLSKACPGECL